MTYKPIVLDETMKEANKKLSDISGFLNILAQDKLATMVQTWDNVAELVKNGSAESIFHVGDYFEENWNDDSQSHQYPFRVNNFETIELESGQRFHGMILQAKYAHPFGVQFSHERAFLKCPEGLAAGTYNVTLAQTWSKAIQGTYQFTIKKAVPKNGRICTKAIADYGFTNVYVYDDKGINQLEEANVTVGSSGINLGTMQYATRNGNLNSMQECHGTNRWKISALRQYLNSDKPKGQWWSAQDEFDIRPNELSTKDGFLKGLPQELKDVIKPIKITTYTNTVQDGGGADITYDKVFLPSLVNMNITQQIAGEGETHKYWKERSASATPLTHYKTYPQMITVNKTGAATYVRLRSAVRSSACMSWYIYSSGYVSNYYYGYYAGSFAPLVAIG